MAISDKNIRITKNTNTPPGNFPKMVFTGSSAGASVVTLEVLDDNTLSFSSNEGQIFSLDSNLTSGTIWSVNDVSGVAMLRASAGATIGLVETVGVVGIGESLPNPGIYKLQVRGQVAFGSTADTNSHFIFNTSSSSTNTNSFQLRRGALAQFFEDGDVLKTTFRANAAQSADANYIWPIGLPAAVGSSVLQSDTSGNLSWVPLAASGGGSGTVTSLTAGTGISFIVGGSGTGTITATGTIRTKRPLNMQFASGYTPLAAGTDNVVLTIPDSPVDGTSAITYLLRDFYIRVETPSAGSSRIQLEKSTGTGAFTLAATGSSYIAGFGLTLTGAGIYTTQTTTFAGAFLTSGDNLRLNWTLLNATHANFSVQLLLEEV
jgi:hypothetical protein